MIIAEDLVLLSYDDERGVLQGGPTDLDTRLAGALLVDLALAGRIDVVPEPPSGTRAQKGAQPPGSVVVHDSAPTTHPLLDTVLEAATTREQLAKDLVNDLSTGLSRKVLEQLADRGVLRREQGKVLGIFPVTRWPAEDSAHEAGLRRTLTAVLVDGQEPDQRTRALLALMKDTPMVRSLVGKEQRKTAENRVKQLAEGDWASGAVQQATDETIALVMTTVILPAAIFMTST